MNPIVSFVLFTYFLSFDTCNSLTDWVIQSNEYAVRKSFPTLYSKCATVAFTIPCILPLNDVEKAKITSPFGERNHPITNVKKHHNGIDIACPVQDVIATGSGVVGETGYSTSLGNFIVINHQNSYQTTYGHLSKIDVQKNQKVSIMSIIGKVGNTGNSTGNHLHYEIRKNGILLNPIDYLLLSYHLFY